MLLGIVLLALPATYVACLTRALVQRPGLGTSILLIVGSLSSAILGAYAGMLAFSINRPGADFSSRMTNDVTSIAIFGPISGLFALGIIWAAIRMRKR